MKLALERVGWGRDQKCGRPVVASIEEVCKPSDGREHTKEIRVQGKKIFRNMLQPRHELRPIFNETTLLNAFESSTKPRFTLSSYLLF
jgi:hypothetical protein